MTYAEFKRLDIYKTMDVVELFDEDGVEIDDSIPEEELNGMDVKAYHVNSGWLSLELGESIAEDGGLNIKTWKIPVCWTMMGTVNIEANTLAEAIEIAQDNDGTIPIPDNGDFLDGSWEVDCTDVDYLREWYNANQKDN